MAINYQAVFHHIPIPLLVMNENKVVLSVNQTFAKQWGEHEIVGSSWLESKKWNSSELLNYVESFWGKPSSAIPTQGVDVTFASSSRRWHLNFEQWQEDAQTLWLVVFQEKTPTISESRLMSSESMWRELIDASPAFIFLKDLHGRHLQVNKAFCNEMKLSKNEMIGKTNYELQGEEVGKISEDIDRKLIETKEPLEMEWHLERPDGKHSYLAFRFPVLDENGKIVAIGGIISDITARKIVEEDLRAAKTELEYSNTELESFAYSVSHDLRAPLRAIDGYVRILHEEYGDILDSEGQRLLGVVRNNAKHMANLIDDLLMFSRLNRQPMKTEKIDFETMVAQTIHDLKAQNSNRTIVTSMAALPIVYGDHNLFRQAWYNLIENAFKYTTPTAAPTIRISFEKNQENLIFGVHDNGVGFDQKYAHKLFLVFQRLHSSKQFEGTGVGLALVHRIVERHGGRVWAEGATNSGASFYFSLPLSCMDLSL
jgi:PAS domain S-box-containing protein